MGFLVAAVTEDRGFLASNAPRAFDPYIFLKEKCRERVGHTSGLNYRIDFFYEKSLLLA